jgi:phosphohistidine phosphatase
MQVYLLRHGIAEEGHVGMRDADRELTAEGKRKLRETLRVLTNADVAPSLILSSPLARAVQTADLARGLLKIKADVLRTKALSPNSTVEQVWEELRVHRDEAELMLVGHEPLFSRLAAYLLGAIELRLDFKKGAVLRVDIESFGHQPKGVLRWFYVSRLASKTVRAGDKGD